VGAGGVTVAAANRREPGPNWREPAKGRRWTDDGPAMGRRPSRHPSRIAPFSRPSSPAPTVSDWPPLPLLEATALCCERGERVLFEGLALRLAPGELVWLRGANGRGKTTLLRTLAGLGTPAAGQLQLGGQPLKGADPAWRRQLVYLGHANALKDDLTAAESLGFATRLAGVPAAAAEVRAALAALGVGALAQRPVRTMSQGQRRRVALARLALAPKPALALLDEPFDALDDDGIDRLAGLLAGIVGAGGAVLFTSHQQIDRLRPVPRVVTLPEAPARRVLQ
jgi:heme exporter protein A